MGADLSTYFINKIPFTEISNISQVNKLFNLICDGHEIYDSMMATFSFSKKIIFDDLLTRKKKYHISRKMESFLFKKDKNFDNLEELDSDDYYEIDNLGLGDYIGYFMNLKKICINRRELTHMPIINLLNLTRLDLWNNNLTEFPKIFKMKNLVNLYLGYNSIDKIPKCINELSNLVNLCLENNSITEIPKQVCQLSKLRMLQMENNKIDKIPTEIGQMKNLEWLCLRDNNITEIPSTIGDVTKLKIFWISDNLINKIPQQITQLTNLRSFIIMDNGLKNIPEFVSELPDLKCCIDNKKWFNKRLCLNLKSYVSLGQYV